MFRKPVLVVAIPYGPSEPPDERHQVEWPDPNPQRHHMNMHLSPSIPNEVEIHLIDGCDFYYSEGGV